MRKKSTVTRVGDIRPSQLMFSYGVGASIDLPHLTVMVMGLDDWPLGQMAGGEIAEPRLLLAAKNLVGPQLTRLLLPPPRPDEEVAAFDKENEIGVPVAPFPRWMRCPKCELLARLDSEQFELKSDPFRPDRARYEHRHCPKGYKKSPTVLPMRFLIACENGHLDDFPWMDYVHRGKPCNGSQLKLVEVGTAGAASSVLVICQNCLGEGKNLTRSMAEAFSAEIGPGCDCSGRLPHLRRFVPGCTEPVKTILLGASNSWFPITLSAFSIPVAVDAVGQLVEEYWAVLGKLVNEQNVALLRSIGQLNAFEGYTDSEIWKSIEAKRGENDSEAAPAAVDLKTPEWNILSQPASSKQSPDFKLREAGPPIGFDGLFERVVLAERLREVHALLGFTRIESPNDWGEASEIPPERRVPLARDNVSWLPAVEVRGEGIFLQLNEARVSAWCKKREIRDYDQRLQAANGAWRQARNLTVPNIVPDIQWARYVLLHSLSHALMRQLCLECGYAGASIRERIYFSEADNENGPMAGILIYTAAADSEGTLGGLVALGEPEPLGHHLKAALQAIEICASDPLCAEHKAGENGLELHDSACHACLFTSETSCERGNKFLDRKVLVSAFGSELPTYFAV